MTERPSLMTLRMQSHRKRRALGSMPVVGSSCNKKNPFKTCVEWYNIAHTAEIYFFQDHFMIVCQKRQTNFSKTKMENEQQWATKCSYHSSMKFTILPFCWTDIWDSSFQYHYKSIKIPNIFWENGMVSFVEQRPGNILVQSMPRHMLTTLITKILHDVFVNNLCMQMHK